MPHEIRGVDVEKYGLLCQGSSPKRWFGNMEMASNCDVTNSEHQMQMTTTWPWTKTPPWKFSAYATGDIEPAGDGPAAFFSRMMNKRELHYCSVEKETLAIIGAVRKWHTLWLDVILQLWRTNGQFHLCAVGKTVGKLKTTKCCGGAWNFMSLISILFIALESLTLLQMRFLEFTALAWMGLHFIISIPRCVTRVSHVLHHFVRAKNLPYSAAQLAKATQPFERLSLDFKGPFPTSTKNRYMLTVIDEFSRFPFAFPFSSVDTKTVISCLNRLFALFGIPLTSTLTEVLHSCRMH